MRIDAELRILDPFRKWVLGEGIPRRLEVLLCFTFCSCENNEEKRDKNGKNEEEPLEEDEFDLAYKMIFTDTLRTRGDQVR